MSSVVMNPLKRNHSQSGGNEEITLANQPSKRPCSSTNGAKSDSINQVYMDALSDISDEIRFAVKCIDRSAVKMTLANISRLAITAIETAPCAKIAPTRVETPNHAHADSQLISTSTIPAATSAQRDVQTLPQALRGLTQFSPSAPTVVLPPPLQPTKSPTPQPPKPLTPVAPKGSDIRSVDTVTPFKKPSGAISNGAPTTPNSTISSTIPKGPSQFKESPPRGPSSADVRLTSRNATTSRSAEHIRNIGSTPPTAPSKSHSIGYNSYRPTENTRRPESPRRDIPRDSQRSGNPPSVATERASRWDLKANPNTSGRDPYNPTEGISKASFSNNNYQDPNFLPTPPPSGPRSSLPKTTPSIIAPTAPAIRTSPTLAEKLETRLSLEATLKITAGKAHSFGQINLQTVLTALKLPNLLRLEIRDSTIYLRLLDSVAAHRIACNYKNFKPDTPLEHQRVLNSIRLYSPSDYAPAVSGETVNAWLAGARRMLVTNSFTSGFRRSESEYDEFVTAAKGLWGYFSLSRNNSGKVWIGFEEVEKCVAGKAALERKFRGIYLSYSEELGKGDV